MGRPQVEVTIKVAKEYADLIRQDSVADVVSPTLIGSEYLEISPGSSGYPKIEPYGAIPSRERKSVTEYLAEIATQETVQQVKLTVANLAQLSEQLKNDEKVVLETVKRVNQVLASLTEGRGTMGMLLMQKDLYARMMQGLDHLDKFLVEAKGLLVDFRPMAVDLQGFTKAINQEIEPLRAIVRNIKTGSEELPDLMEAATDTARSAKETMDAIKANPLIRLTAPKGAKSQTIHVAPRTLP